MTHFSHFSSFFIFPHFSPFFPLPVSGFRFPVSAGGPLLPLLALAASGFRFFLIFPYVSSFFQFSSFSPFFPCFHHFPPFFLIFPHFSSFSFIFPQCFHIFIIFHHFSNFSLIFPHFRFRFPVSGFGWGSPAAAPCLGGFRFPVSGFPVSGFPFPVWTLPKAVSGYYSASRNRFPDPAGHPFGFGPSCLTSFNVCSVFSNFTEVSVSFGF